MVGARERRSSDDGFTLLELVVVTIIIGILATIAIAVFFAQREKAERSSAISSVRNTMTLAETIRFEGSEYTDDPDAYRNEGGTGFTFVKTESTSPRVVSIATYEQNGNPTPDPPPVENARGPVVVMASEGGGRCYWARQEVGENPVRDFFEMDEDDSCDAAGSLPDGAGLWKAPGDGW